ncbi:MAG: hypothetical protein K5655_09285 [Lachnospiraceae bacterium]|nr:hypothetical protein [Lachnospiraceae bacterium]
MQVLKRTIFILINCTWGIGATLIGLIVFLINIKKPHKIYRCAIDTRWNKRAGLSLGLFTFTPGESIDSSQPIRVHEYGHCIQNMVLGPFMIFIGAVSLLWANLPCFVILRRTKNIPYTKCFVESWASRWGEKVTKEKAIWN